MEGANLRNWKTKLKLTNNQAVDDHIDDNGDGVDTAERKISNKRRQSWDQARQCQARQGKTGEGSISGLLCAMNMI